MNTIQKKKIGFIGAGNMAQALIQALTDSKLIDPGNIMATNRSEGKLKRVTETFGITAMPTNEELVDASDLIVLAVKPQDLAQVLEPIASAFHTGHLVISLAAGFSTAALSKLIPNAGGIARAMPNTPATIQKAVVGYCLAEGSEIYRGTVEDFLKPLGLVVPAEEGGEFEALTVGCGSGTAFVFEMMLYWQEWLEEHGFESLMARRMVVQTFLGAAQMVESHESMPISDLQDRVVSKKGVTHAGLQSMRELELERVLRFSFEKAALRDQEISRGTSRQ